MGFLRRAFVLICCGVALATTLPGYALDLPKVVAFVGLTTMGGYPTVPAWAVGDFKGTHSVTQQEVTLSLVESGAVSLTLVNQDGSKSTKKGSYQEGKITIGETSYFLSKGKKGSVRIIQEEDSEFTVDLQKIGSPPPSVVSPPHDEKRSDNQPAPRWAVGFFRGSNRKYNLTVDLVIFADGSAVAETIDSVKKKNRVTGGYRGNGILRLGPNDYYLEQMDNSIITTQKRDRTNQVAFQRQANGPTALAPSRNGAGVPEWLVGTFRGKANKYHFEMELTLKEDGSATVQTTDTEGKKNKVVGTYKNGVLRFGRFDYDVQRAEKGFRTTQTNDPDNFVDYHR